MPKLAHFFEQRNMPYEAMSDQIIASRFSTTLPDGSDIIFKLLVLIVSDNLGDDYIRFAILPYIPRPDQRYLGYLYDLVAQINYYLPQLKLAFDHDGDLGLFLDIPANMLDDARFDFALQQLADYGGLYYPELATPPTIELDEQMIQKEIERLSGELETGFKQLEWRVTRFQESHRYDHKAGGKLPRNYDWRPYRFCVQDVMLGATVVKHARDDNCLIVDVFLTTDIPEYEMGSGARALTVFLLSEAFKCGGTMEIRFTRNVESGRVPAALQQVALEAGMQLAHENKIMPAESRQLYLALTGFSPTLQQQIEALDHVGMLSVERACYAVHHGVWTRPEVESIILGSRYPDSILGGKAQPEQRHLFLQDLLYARAAVLGSFLDRKLAKRDVPPEVNRVVELEDTERSIEITFEPEFYAKRYRCDQDPLPLPWLADDGPQLAPINRGDWLIALIRARDVADLRRHFGQDLGAAQRLAVALLPDNAPHTVVVLVPHDFDELPPQERQGWLNAAQEVSVGILVCPETVASLDADVVSRLARSRILRE